MDRTDKQPGGLENENQTVGISCIIWKTMTVFQMGNRFYYIGRTLYELVSKNEVMKLRFVIFALLGIFAITLSIHDAFGQTEKIDEKNIGYLHYENDEIGVTLEYPSDWKLVEDIQNVPFVARFWAPGASGLISMDHIYRDTDISPEDLAESYVKRLESMGSTLISIETKPHLVSEYPAWQLTYSGLTHELRPYTLSKVYVVADNSRYIFSYDGGQYSVYLTVFNSIVDSVQISPTINAGSSSDAESSSHMQIPDWVEHNVRWWHEGKIDDNTMISAIKFLGDSRIITMPTTKEIDFYKITRGDDPEIYEHIQHNAWTWAESDLRPENFLKGIGYLASLNSQDETSNEPRNPDGCPQSFSSRCFTGTVTEIFNGDTIQVDHALFRLSLVYSPNLEEQRGQEAKAFLEEICPIGSDALVDQDDLRPLEGPSGSSRILGVVYCNGLNLNEELVEFDFEYFEGMYCHTSEFADDPWAREGCSDWGLIRK